DVRSLLESHRQSPAPRDPAHRQTRGSPAPGCPQQRSHPDTREAERPVYGLHSGRSASSHRPQRIIQNYNSTGVFTQPLTTASVAIDGSKFKAVNNRDKNFTRAKMERRLAQIE